jgi:ADP-heptose:LPS heptosyltransferase
MFDGKHMWFHEGMDILIVKLGALGDVINTLPLAISLKSHLKARVHWLVAPLSLPIVSRHPAVDRTIIFDKNQLVPSLTEVGKQIRAQSFDITLDLQRTLKSSLFCLASKSRRRIGFDRMRCKEMSWMFPFERIPLSQEVNHMVLQYLEFARYLGVPQNDICWDIQTSGRRPAIVPKNYIVLNIGATKEANKWTPEGFATLIGAVQKRYALASVITGGKEDMGMVEKIMTISSGAGINLVGKTTVNELTEVLHHSKVVVTCDTGPMHLAVALGREVVALFGPSDFRRTGPFKGYVIEKKLPCSPCNKRNCPDPQCMKQITTEDVLRKLSVILR